MSISDSKMKRGDIIRFKSSLGRYIRITDVNKSGIFGIYLSKVGNISEETRISCPEAYVTCNVYRLSISKEDLERIQKYPTIIKHEATASWDKLIDEMISTGVDIIMFYNRHRKVYYTFDGIKRTFSPMWNKDRTKCKKVPCITIILGSIIAVE